MFLEKFPYRVKFYTKGRFGHTCGVRVLRIDRPLAGGFLSLTALQAEGCGGALRAQIIKEGGAAGAAGCVEGLRRFRSGGRQPFGPRVMVAPFGRRFYKKEARPIVISTVAERSGEISRLNGQKRSSAFAAGCLEGLHCLRSGAGRQTRAPDESANASKASSHRGYNR